MLHKRLTLYYIDIIVDVIIIMNHIYLVSIFIKHTKTVCYMKSGSEMYNHCHVVDQEFNS